MTTFLTVREDIEAVRGSSPKGELIDNRSLCALKAITLGYRAISDKLTKQKRGGLDKEEKRQISLDIHLSQENI